MVEAILSTRLQGTTERAVEEQAMLYEKGCDWFLLDVPSARINSSSTWCFYKALGLEQLFKMFHQQKRKKKKIGLSLQQPV